jgi:hypothetical protein
MRSSFATMHTSPLRLTRTRPSRSSSATLRASGDGPRVVHVETLREIVGCERDAGVVQRSDDRSGVRKRGWWRRRRAPARSFWGSAF